MFDYRKANRQEAAAKTTHSGSASRPTAPSASTSSEQSQARGLSYLRTLKTNLQHSASQILAGPDPSPHVTDDTDVTNVPPPRLRTQAKIQAEEALADEKDKVAVAEELQRYITEGVLDEAELKDFSLTRYWQVS